MLVKDVMNPEVKTIDPKASVKKAAEEMSKFRIGCLIVVSEEELVGIITERDIMTKLVAESKDAAKTTVKEIMTKDVVFIKPDADIEEASEAMIENHVKRMPVVFDSQLIGIITSMDIVNAQPKIIEQMGELLVFPKKKKPVAG
jgi:CBS domain-containing protein